MTTPVTRPFSSDQSYELPLRRNIFLLLLDLLVLLRFIAGVLLDRLGVAPCHDGVLLPGGQSWGGEVMDAVAAERIMEAALRAYYSSSGISSCPRTTGPLYMRRRASLPPAADRGADSSAEDDEGAADCAICLAGLDAGGGCQVAELCSCSHAFHAACIDAWITSSEAVTCPLCRAPVTPAVRDGVGATSPRPAD